MPEDQQPQPQQAPKSIDGVKPAPRLSGENQQHHLQETTADQPAQHQTLDGVKPPPQLQAGQASQKPLQLPPLQTDDQLKQQPQETTQTQESDPQKPDKKPIRDKPPRSNFPYIAVTLAVVIGSGLIGLAVFLQLNS